MEVHFKHLPLSSLTLVQRLTEELQLAVNVKFQKPPLDLSFRVPFRGLTELRSHEQQFLAGMAPHIGEERADICEALPLVTRHLVEESPLAVDDLIVGN